MNNDIGNWWNMVNTASKVAIIRWNHPWAPFTYGRRSINGPMSNYFQANDHQLSLEIPNFNKVGYRRCEGCSQEELGVLTHMCCGDFRIYDGANVLKF